MTHDDDPHIGRYRILGPLGAGGMGEVLLAEDPALGRRVAIKQVGPRRASVPDAMARLRREAQAAARIAHPGVATVHDVVEQDGTPYVVMELVPGSDLTALVKQGRQPAEEVVRLGCVLAEAIAAAHAQGVIHRDLKPSNVRITPDGRVKILDFGISKLLEPPLGADAPTELTPSLTRVGESVGTPGYSAPEQLLGQPVDGRADVFGLGATLYELVTGQPPFKRENALATVLATIHTPATRADVVAPAVPTPLADVLARAMAIDPAHRYPTANAFRDALAGLSSSGASVPAPAHPTPGTGTHVPTSTSPVPPHVGRHAVWIIAVLLLGLSGGLAWRWYGGHGAGAVGVGARSAAAARTAPRAVAVLPPQNLSGDAANDYLAVGLADSLFTDLSEQPGLRVLSPADVRTDAESTTRALPALAARLGAQMLVDASLQRAGEQLRVNVRLADADGTIVWSGRFDGTLAGIFDLQRRLSAGVLGGLDHDAAEGRAGSVTRPPTGSVPALSAYWRGRTLLERADVPAKVDEAIGQFEQAIALDPQFASAHAGLGEALWARYGHTGETELVARAIAASERALAIDPAQARVWMTLALVYNGTGRVDSALDDVRKAISLQPDNDDAHRLLGDILAGRGDLPAAEDAYRQAIARRPGFWRNHYRLGVLFYRQGRYADAVEAFRQATTLEPEAAAGYQAMGTAMQAAGDLAGARAQYERALAIGPTRNAYSNLGTLHYWEGRYEEARQAYEAAIARYPGEALFHRNLGDTLRRLGRDDDAQGAYGVAASLLEQQLRVNPAQAPIRADLAVVEMKRGRAARARQQMARAVADAPDDPDVLYSRAIVLTLDGRPDEAWPVLRQAFEAGASVALAERDDDLAAVRAGSAWRTWHAAPR